MLVGDYLLNDLTVLSLNKLTDDLKSKVIGVCVCPDGVLPDGKARFCGLNDLEGINGKNLYWGYYNEKIDELPSLSGGPIISNFLSIYKTTDDPKYSINSSYLFGEMITDKVSDYKITNPKVKTDILAGYSTGYNGVIPSIYIYQNEGDKLQLNPEFNKELLSYFNGKENTQVLWDLMKDLVTDNIIEHYYQKAHYYEAAGLCHVHTTKGTNIGDWYLPSIAELALFKARSIQINLSLNDVGGYIIEDLYYWSSTLNDNSLAWYLNFRNGIQGWNKGSAYRVRPFIILPD